MIHLIDNPQLAVGKMQINIKLKLFKHLLSGSFTHYNIVEYLLFLKSKIVNRCSIFLFFPTLPGPPSAHSGRSIIQGNISAGLILFTIYSKSENVHFKQESEIISIFIWHICILESHTYRKGNTEEKNISQ